MTKNHWHYGLIMHIDPKGAWYGIHEVYQGEKLGWTAEPVRLVAETPEEIKEQLAMILKNLKTCDTLVVDESDNLLHKIKNEKSHCHL